MKCILLSNSKIGGVGYGFRTQKIVEGCIEEGFDLTIFGRSFKFKKNKTYRKIVPFPFANAIYYLIEFLRVYIKTNFFLFNNLLIYDRRIFDFFTSIKMDKKAEILHTWENSAITLKKAKRLGMITFKDYCMYHDDGAKKLLPHIKELKKISTSKEEKEAIKYSDYFFAPSEFTKNTLIAAGIDKNRIFLNPFGVDTKLFFPKRTRHQKFTLLFVGVVRERKGIKTLFEAVSKAKIYNYELILCGRITKEAKKMIEEYSDKINLKILGYVPYEKLNKVYNSADVFVFPSLIEGSAKVTYEAMACGLPLITTETAGSVARNKKDGFIIPVQNQEILKNRIEYFYNNPQIIKKMGKNARKHIEKYTWEEYSKRTIGYYKKAMEILN